MYARGINFDFLDVQGITTCNLRVVICPTVVYVCLAFKKSLDIRPCEIDTSKGIIQNKYTLMNLPDPVYGHSPVVYAGKSV